MSNVVQAIRDKILADERKRQQRERKEAERYFLRVMGKFARRFSLGKPVLGLMADTNMPFVEWDGLTIILEQVTRSKGFSDLSFDSHPFIVVTVIFGDGAVKHGVYVHDHDDELARCIVEHRTEGSDDQ